MTKHGKDNIVWGPVEWLTAGDVTSEVLNEMEAQFWKWGEQNHEDGTSEAFQAEASVQRKLNDEAGDRLTWRDILEEEFWEAAAERNPEKLREELVQVAAVACSWILAIDRRKGKK